MRLTEWEGMRASTVRSQSSGSTPISLADPIGL
jgi:hypothetical protein